ncbi:DUF3037 domain-containing protein [Brachymonas denitrificans]|uniref:DUF3037 domain-containing protein n=1 Tax=Brachymonas denitrificans TaxID=28220 RepID=UPI002AFE62B9|nr:DUF3037 domain-containing protein [Brachymonas denitrificans]
MNKLACRYALVQFQPFAETGEFANIGVVLACPSTGYFDFRLQLKQVKRITDFFRPVSREHYLAAARYMRDVLEQTRRSLTGLRGDAVRGVLDDFLHPREAVIRFGRQRAVLAQDPAQELERLYESLVNRSHASRKHVEDVLAREISDVVNSLPLVAPFRQTKLGDDFLSAEIPLVQTVEGVHVKAIKPLNLDVDKANDVHEKWILWAGKLRLLHARSMIPDQMAFVLHMPEQTDDIHVAEAAQEARWGLQEAGAQVFASHDNDALKRFALQ